MRPESPSRAAGHGARHRAQRVAQLGQRCRLEPAGDAFLQVALDEHLLLHRQLAVVVGRQVVAHPLARKDVHHPRTSLNCAAQRLTRAREPGLDGAHRHVERIGNLFVAQPVYLPQDDDRSLIERQRVQRRPEPRRHLLARKRAVGRVAVTRLPQLAVIEHVLFELHLIGAAAPAPPALTIARLVDGDPVNPGPERRLTAERVNGAEDPQEHFLRQVEGLVTIAQQVQGELKHHPFVAGTSSAHADSSPAAQRCISAASPVPTSVQPSAPASFTSCSAMSRDCIKSINSPPSLLLPQVRGLMELEPGSGRKVPSRLRLWHRLGSSARWYPRLRVRRWLVALGRPGCGRVGRCRLVYTAYATDREYSR